MYHQVAVTHKLQFPAVTLFCIQKANTPVKFNVSCRNYSMKRSMFGLHYSVVCCLVVATFSLRWSPQETATNCNIDKFIDSFKELITINRQINVDDITFEGYILLETGLLHEVPHPAVVTPLLIHCYNDV